MYLGLPGSGKTTILAKSLTGIKMHNKNIQPKRAGMKPTILFITAEDTMDAMVGRIHSDLCPHTNIKDKNIPADEISKQLKDVGFEISETNPIDVDIRYFDVKEIDTNDIYGIIEEVQSDNKEVICLIVDYVKRIRPALYAKEEKDELRNVTNELRNIAVNYDIPVITAAQYNREAAKTVDAAKMQNKKDLSKQIGRGQIGGSFAMQENADAMVGIDSEFVGEGEEATKYMTFNKLKLRYGDYKVDYFAHPYARKGSNLIDDMHLPKGEYYSKDKLAEDLGGEDMRVASNNLLGNSGPSRDRKSVV